MHIPTVDIGPRQRARIAAGSVIHCSTDADSILAALEQALSPGGQEAARLAVNPYYQPDTLERMVSAIAGADPESLRVKHFHDL